MAMYICGPNFFLLTSTEILQILIILNQLLLAGIDSESWNYTNNGTKAMLYAQIWATLKSQI
jgi:hypothetical protein